MKSKKQKIICGVICGIIVVASIVSWLVFYQIPHSKAVKDYKSVVSVIDNKNAELDTAIEKLQGLIDANEKVIDTTVVDKAKDVCKRAGAEKLVLEKMPSKTEDIIIKTNELSTPPDYTAILKELEDTYTAYDTSIQQYKQLTNPSEDFVIQRLKTVDEITDVRAVTEDNDPNGKLNKPGGYTATVYFESKNVNQSNVYGNDLIDKGTDAGGAVEVYVNEEDAKKREEYLATFDGGIFASGSHRVVGTCLIRTSDELSASKQNALEEKVINALAGIKTENVSSNKFAAGYYDALNVKKFTIDVPNYYEEEGSKNDYLQYYAEKGDKCVMLSIAYLEETDDNYDVSFDGLYADNENMISAVASMFTDGDVISDEVFESDYGVKGMLYRFTCNQQTSANKNIDAGGYCFCYPSANDRRWFYVVLILTNNVEGDKYEDDYMKLIASIKEN